MCCSSISENNLKVPEIMEVLYCNLIGRSFYCMKMRLCFCALAYGILEYSKVWCRFGKYFKAKENFQTDIMQFYTHCLMERESVWHYSMNWNGDNLWKICWSDSGKIWRVSWQLSSVENQAWLVFIKFSKLVPDSVKADNVDVYWTFQIKPCLWLVVHF